MLLIVFSDETYTLETIIQAGQKDMAIISVPIRTNEDLRPSRLLKSISSYINRSVVTIFRIFVVYISFRFFMTICLFLFSMGGLLGVRFIYYAYLIQDGTSRVQSLILASVLLGIGLQTLLVAFVADLLSVNRRLMEDIQYRLKDRGIDKLNTERKSKAEKADNCSPHG